MDADLKKFVDEDESIYNVVFAGAVTNVPDYLSAMDVFIPPSRFERTSYVCLGSSSKRFVYDNIG